MDGKIPVAEIVRIVGRENVLTSPEDRCCYSYDASRLTAAPDCVVFPANVGETAELMKLANRERLPVFPRGAGSGIVGGALPFGGGMVVVLTRLNRILEVDADNMLAVVEPGVVTGDLQRRVLQDGLFYPPDPASLNFSTMGGNVAMCSGGPRAVKYGVTRDYVLGMEVVLPTGAVIRTGSRTVKGVVGYDLTRLMVGSEGTLGLFTKITLRLLPAPEGLRTLLAVFPRLDDAVRTVCEIIRSRVIPSTLELMDQASIRAVEDYAGLGLPPDIEAILLVEVDGREIVLDGDAEQVRRIAAGCGAARVEIARSGQERESLWKARRSISPALGRIRPDKINEDVVVPRTRIPELIRSIGEIARKHRLTIVNFGHAGDGNIHTNVMLDRKDRDELHRAGMAVEELFGEVLRLGGTISGEHGIGVAKSPFFLKEVGKDAFDAMWRIKQALDPLNILNPGKMFTANRAFFDA